MTNKLLAEADAIISGERHKEYGDFASQCDRVCKLWGAILGVSVTPTQFAFCMMCLKMHRELHAHKRDNLVDIGGYLGLLDGLAAETTTPSTDEVRALRENLAEILEACRLKGAAPPTVLDEMRRIVALQDKHGGIQHHSVDLGKSTPVEPDPLSVNRDSRILARLARLVR